MTGKTVRVTGRTFQSKMLLRGNVVVATGPSLRGFKGMTVDQVREWTKRADWRATLSHHVSRSAGCDDTTAQAQRRLTSHPL
jgi:hypothetical protein